MLQTIDVTPPLPPVTYVAMFKANRCSDLMSAFISLAQQWCDFSDILLSSTTVSQIQPDIPATRTARKLAGDGAGDEHSQRRNRVRHVSLDSLGCLEECNLRVGKTLLVERGFF